MIRRALLATILGIAAVTAATSAPAQARPCKIDYACITTWYSDSTQTTAVGGRYESCSGEVTMWGTRSAYVSWDESPC